MNSNVKEVYSFYKQLYPQTIVLFRIMDQYEAYFEDARQISEVLKLPKENTSDFIALPANNILDNVSILSEGGLTCVTIVARNKAGEYALPDISVIQEEQNSDY